MLSKQLPNAIVGALRTSASRVSCSVKGRRRTRVSSAHHVLGIEHLLRQLRHGQRAVLLGATRRERREAIHEEMQPRKNTYSSLDAPHTIDETSERSTNRSVNFVKANIGNTYSRTKKRQPRALENDRAKTECISRRAKQTKLTEDGIIWHSISMCL